MTGSSDFWDALAPHHATLENSYLDLPSLRCLLPDIHPPVLVVGAGQGLIVAELQKQGIHCDGVDLSAEMIRYARLRRGLALVHADARALPFGNGAYKTIIYATGVIDFMSDDEEIREIMNEGRRVADPSGNIFVAFYKFSAATEEFVMRLGLLRKDAFAFRSSWRFTVSRRCRRCLGWRSAQTSVTLEPQCWRFAHGHFPHGRKRGTPSTCKKFSVK